MESLSGKLQGVASYSHIPQLDEVDCDEQQQDNSDEEKGQDEEGLMELPQLDEDSN